MSILDFFFASLLNREYKANKNKESLTVQINGDGKVKLTERHGKRAKKIDNNHGPCLTEVTLTGVPTGSLLIKADIVTPRNPYFNPHPHHGKETPHEKMCDYILLFEQSSTIQSLFIEMKSKNTRDALAQITSGYCLVQYIHLVSQQIHEKIYDVAIHPYRVCFTLRDFDIPNSGTSLEKSIKMIPVKELQEVSFEELIR